MVCRYAKNNADLEIIKLLSKYNTNPNYHYSNNDTTVVHNIIENCVKHSISLSVASKIIDILCNNDYKYQFYFLL